MSQLIPYEDEQILLRSMSPQETTDKNSGYLGLDNVADPIIGIEVVLDEEELQYLAHNLGNHEETTRSSYGRTRKPPSWMVNYV